MYHQRLIINNVPDADQIYIQKLRTSISEMTVIKDRALQDENYNLADMTRSKITALKLQLSKLEDSFNADVIIGFITQWQNGLASAAAQYLEVKVNARAL